MTTTGPRPHAAVRAEDDARLRVAATRATSAGMAALTAALVVAALVGGVSEPAVLFLGTVAVAYHVGVTWLPWDRLVRSVGGDVVVGLHLGLSIALIGAGLLVVDARVGPELLWLFTLTTAQAAATRTARGQVVTFVATAVVASVAGGISGAVGVLELGIALVALAALAVLSRTVCRSYLEAVSGQSEARRAADVAADRAVVLSQASRALVDDRPEAVLAAIVATTERIGYPYSGVYEHDPVAREVRYVAARGLAPELRGARFPDDSGVAGMVLEVGDTVVLDDYPQHPRANPAFVDLLTAAIGTPIRGADAQVLGVLVCGRDDAAPITTADRQVFELLAAHAGRALQLAEGLRDERLRVAELAELDRLKSDFVATVSHELRTPLTVVCGLSETIATRWDHLDTALVRDLVGRIHANATALDDVIATLLDVGSLEQGRLRPQRVLFDLSAAVERSTSRLEPVLDRHRLSTTITPGVHVEGDPRLLDRVFENLLSNTARHTPPDTAVHVAVQVTDDHVRVAVEDEGGGMPAHDVGRIGERFFRGGAHDTRQTRGMGLGLALAREVLQLHDSDLEVRSTLGEGTTFAFRLPVVAAPSAPLHDVTR